jgi:hypothetical protein
MNNCCLPFVIPAKAGVVELGKLADIVMPAKAGIQINST